MVELIVVVIFLIVRGAAALHRYTVRKAREEREYRAFRKAVGNDWMCKVYTIAKLILAIVTVACGAYVYFSVVLAYFKW